MTALTYLTQRGLINPDGSPIQPPPSNKHKQPQADEPPKRAPSPVAKDEGEAATIDQAKDMMEGMKQWIDEITDYAEWVPKVMQSDKPVILDCYAE